MDLTAERARALLAYDPATGVLRWRVTLGPRARAGNTAGSLSKQTGYRSVRLDGKLYQAHRVIWLMEHGEWPHQIDHRHRQRDDNRRSELRETSDALNRQNVEVVRSDSQTGLKGVGFDKRRGVFTSFIRKDGRAYFLGSFGTAQEAHEAYLAAKAVLHEAWVPSLDVEPVPELLTHENARKRVRSDCKVGVLGVSAIGKKFRARFRGKHLGLFDTPEVAHSAFVAAREAHIAATTA